MATTTSPLTALGIASSPTLLFPDTAESRNCLVLGPVRKPPIAGWDLPAFERKANDFDTPLAIQQDPNLAFIAGGLASGDATLRPRAVAVPGPGCTLMGIARSLLKKVNTAAGTSAPLTDLELARALLAYNKDFLGYTGPPPIPLRPLQNWVSGMYLTLPLEFNEAASTWATYFPSLRTWGATLTVADDPALGDPARPLTLPDFDALATDVAAALAAHPDILQLAVRDNFPAGSGPGLRRQLLSNPFEAVFRYIEVLRQLRAGGPAGEAPRKSDVLDMIVGLCETLTVQVLHPVAQSTAGNAVLRAFQIAIEDAAPAEIVAVDPTKLARTQTVLAKSLGLVASTATTWKPIREFGPTVQAQELPLTPAQQTQLAGGNYFLWANVFGYPLEISKAPADHGVPSWNKLSFPVSIAATTWLAANGSDPDIDRPITTVNPAAPHNAAAPRFPPIVIELDKVRQRAQVAARISAAEGGVDSVQAGDNGMISFGLQQWAAHTEDELTVLFERFRAVAPDHYDLLFGSLGLQTKRWIGTMAPVVNSNHVPDPPPNDVDDANPYGPDPATLGDPFDPTDEPAFFDYFPFYVTLVEVPPGQAAENLPAPKFGSGLGRRYAFLMKNGRFRLWCARARLAGLYSRPYVRAQVQQAVFRFTRIEHELATKKFSPTDGAPFAVPSAGVTTLKTSINATVLKVPVVSGRVFPSSAPFMVRCERELMLCTARVGDTLTVQRGRNGTTAAGHATDASIGRASEFAAVSGALDALATSIPVKSGGLYLPGAQGVRLICDQEVMYCTARIAGALTVQRGYEGSVAATHTDGTILYRLEGDTVLSAAIAATDTSIGVNDSSFLPAAGNVVLRCGAEIMTCTASAGNTLTVVRGQEDTTSAPHPAGSLVYRVAGYAELFDSEFAAGTVLDIHINEPDIPIPAVHAAIRRTPGDTHAADGTLDPAWLRRFGVNYLATRAFQPGGRPWMNAGTRNNAMVVLHDRRPDTVGGPERGLSPDPGTFKAWRRSRP